MSVVASMAEAPIVASVRCFLPMLSTSPTAFRRCTVFLIASDRRYVTSSGRWSCVASCVFAAPVAVNPSPPTLPLDFQHLGRLDRPSQTRLETRHLDLPSARELGIRIRAETGKMTLSRHQSSPMFCFPWTLGRRFSSHPFPPPSSREWERTPSRASGPSWRFPR